MLGRRPSTPVIVAVVAIVAGLVVGWLAFFSGDETASTAAHHAGGPTPSGAQTTPTPSALPTKTLTSRGGGFSLAVPTGLTGRLDKGTAYLVSPDKSLVMVVGPSRPGSLKSTNKAITATMRDAYRKVTVSGSQSQAVNGRAGLSTFGMAVNKRGVRVRFVQLSVLARPRNYTIATYAAADSDPKTVLPRVNAVVNSFHVTPVAKKKPKR